MSYSTHDHINLIWTFSLQALTIIFPPSIFSPILSPSLPFTPPDTCSKSPPKTYANSLILESLLPHRPHMTLWNLTFQSLQVSCRQHPPPQFHNRGKLMLRPVSSCADTLSIRLIVSAFLLFFIKLLFLCFNRRRKTTISNPKWSGCHRGGPRMCICSKI